MKSYHPRLVASLTFSALLCFASQSMAHFTWVSTDDQGHALLFFSEGPHERDYHVPEAVAKAELTATDIKGESHTVPMVEVEEKGYIGRRSEKADFAESTLSTSFTYGIYGDTLLTYYAKYVPAITGRPPQKRPKLDVDAKRVEEGLELTVYWEGKPLEAADVSVAGGEEKPARVKTDEKGVAKFTSLEQGLVGFLVGHVLKDVSGNLDDKSYTSESHYCTVTFHYSDKAKESAVEIQSALPELPEGLASFGSTVCDGSLYVYSGHIGTAHDHSRENLSQSFRRVSLDGQGEWEELPMQTPLQGLPMVSHGGYVYRVGGLNARNAPEEDEDLHSVDEFCRFDPKTKTWTALAPLPEPRSSHDAVVVGDKLYVVGGWQLSGPSEGDWLETAWVCDLSADAPKWEAIAKPPFQRRALATAAWGDKIVVIGGMSAEGEVSDRADCFDPATGEWTQLGDYPGGGMAGFGMSAWGMNGTVFASGWEGVLYKLSSDGQEWNQVDQLQLARFFHRLMPSTNGSIYVVAGATMQGHVGVIEEVSVQ